MDVFAQRVWQIQKKGRENRPMWYDRMIKAAAAGMLVLSFWSIFYPELTLTQDSYRRIEKDADADPAADYRAILNAQKGDVEIRLSFWKYKD